MLDSAGSSNGATLTALDATHFVVTYRDSTNNNYDTAVACSTSGTTVTCGTPVVFSNDTNGPRQTIALDATHFVFSYSDSTNNNYDTAVACSTSGTTVTCGTPVLDSAGSSNGGTLTDLDSTHFVFSYSDSTTNGYDTAVACSTSGTTVTCGTPVVFSNDTGDINDTVVLDATHFVVTYQDSTNNGYDTAVACSTSGTTVTCGALAEVFENNRIDIANTVVLDSAHFVFAYKNETDGVVPNYGVVEGVVSGTTISFSAPEVYEYNANSDIALFAFNGTDFVSFDGLNASVDVAGTTIGRTIVGVATAAASAGQSVNVVYQGVVSGFSGLTAGTVYYANGDGSLTTLVTANRVGVALSGSQILLSHDTGVLEQGSASIINNEFFGDAIFQNGFRITEAKSGTPALDFLNQKGEQIASLDANGNLAVTGALAASGLSTLSGGVLSLASSTIGNGTQAGGLTIDGGATTTGNAHFEGNVAIGTSSPYSKLTVWGPDAASSTLAFNVVNSASTTVFAVFDGGNAQLSGTLTQSSDQRLKTNIQSLDASSSLALIAQLNPVTFNWIDPNQGTGQQVGFIAQQVQQIFPELVSTTSATALTPGGTLGLNYIGLIAPIVSAIQALYTDVLALEQTVAGFAQSFVSDNITVNNTLCIKKSDGTPACITGNQLAAMVAAANQSPSGAQRSPAATSSLPESVTQNSASTTPQTTPPVIQINGDSPAIIQVGDTYSDLGATITGPSQDLNLGIQTFLNGVPMSPVQIDTTQAATDTIDYVVTDQSGLTSTSTRTVLIEPSPSAPASDPSTDAAASTTDATSTAQ